MNNEVTTYNQGGASLLEMRSDSARFPRIKTMPMERVAFEMSKIVSQAFLYRGQTADLNTIQFIGSSLSQELLADTKYGAGYLSLAEIHEVVKRAILDSDMFISVSSLYRVIMAYVKGEGHAYQKQVEQSRPEAKQSAVSARLQAAAGEFINTHKIQ